MDDRPSMTTRLSPSGWPAIPLADYVAQLPLTRRRLLLEARDSVTLPAFAGSLWHSVLGPALKELVCVNQPDACQPCARRPECAYPRVMEAESPRSAEGPLGRGARVPGPLILDVGSWERRRVAAGERFNVAFAVVTADASLADYVAEALALGAARGLGRERGRASVVESCSLDGLEGDLAPDRASAGRVELTLLTPLRLKRRGALLRRFDLAALARDLSLRLAALGHYHGGLAWPAPWMEAIAQAERATTTARTRWVEGVRYSARQAREIVVGGLVGRVQIEGTGPDLVRLLRVGAVLHAGKGTSLGLGQMEIVVSPEGER